MPISNPLNLFLALYLSHTLEIRNQEELDNFKRQLVWIPDTRVMERNFPILARSLLTCPQGVCTVQPIPSDVWKTPQSSSP